MWNVRRVQFQLIEGVAGSVGMHAELELAHAYVNLVIDGRDAPVFLYAHFEFRNGLRLDYELREFLVLGQHYLHRPPRHFRQVRDQRIKSLGCQS